MANLALCKSGKQGVLLRMRRKVQTSQFRESLLIAGPAILLVAFAFWFAYQFVEPAPPASVKMTTGSESGGYYAFAQKYKRILAD